MREANQAAAARARIEAAMLPRADQPVASVLVVGDSVALTLGLGLQEVAAANDLIVVNRSKMGCGIIHGGDVWVLGRVETIRDDCGDWGLRWAGQSREFDPDVALVLLGAWDAYDRRIDGSWIPFGSRRVRCPPEP